MEFSFDHLVHFVQNPQEAVEEMKSIGLHAFAGGNHEKWGTFNSLAYFGLSYIEFLGIRDRVKAEEAALHHDLTNQAINLLPTIQGFNRIALRTNQIEKVAEKARILGFKIDGPVEGARTRDDGVTIRWKMLFIKHEQTELPFPFIIQWDQSDEERRLDLKEKINGHSIGRVEIEDLVFAVHDLERQADKWSRLFGLKKSAPYVDEDLKATCIQLSLGGGNLSFASPSGDGFLSDYMNQRGEGPFLLRLQGEQSIPAQKILGSYFQVIGQG
ncbi:VOC family protein [Bacillus sp. APMAM]|nr:VOC family protein [Bacillus sp. APMAM]RTZ53625.1 VOC family protein [Bacillus sp. SAJ1]